MEDQDKPTEKSRSGKKSDKPRPVRRLQTDQEQYDEFVKLRVALKQDLLDSVRNGAPMADEEFIRRDREIRRRFMRENDSD